MGTRWALLSICVPLLFCREPRIIGITVAVLGFMALSLLWSPDPFNGLDLWWHFALIAMLVALAPASMIGVYWAMGLGLAVNSCVVLVQLFGFEPVTHIPAASGLFFNTNQQSCIVVLVFIALLSLDNWKATALGSWTLMPLFAGGMSRTSLVALAAAGAFALKGWMRWTALGGGVVLLAVLVGWSNRIDSNLQRVQTWMDMAGNLSLLGNGLGSFRFAYPVLGLGGFVGEHAHNDLLQISYELGFIGALAFVAFGLLVIRGAGTERLILIAFAVEGLFDFPLYQPATAFFAALCAGAVLRRRAELRGDLPSREHVGYAGQMASRPA